MERFFAVLRDGVNRFDGRIDKFTGDGVMVLFGAPVGYEDHARLACAAALALRDDLARFAASVEDEHGLAFSVRMGLNSGEVVAGPVGEDLKVEYTAVGNTVALAQRMESLAAPGAAYLTGAIAALVEGFFELRDLGPRSVRGAADPVPVFELVGHGPARTPLQAAAAKGFSHFVGRDREMAMLGGAFADTAKGDGQVVGVVAEPGVGKSRLCHEFAQRCRADGFDVFVAHGLSHARSVPFVPVLEMLRSQFGIREADDPVTVRGKLAVAVGDADPALVDALPLLSDFLGVADPDHPAAAIDPEARQRRIFDVLNRLRRARSIRAPFVMLVEDLHWLDPGSETFLENLVSSVPGTRQLVVTTFRPEYRAPWAHRSHYAQLPLLPLRDEARDELVAELLGTHPSLDGVAELVRGRSGGNPFFIEEIIQGLVEEGYLSGPRGAYQLAGTIDEMHIPATVQAVLGARIDRLRPADKHLLQTAAVVGRQFSRRVVGVVAGLPETELDAALASLVDAELVYGAATYPDEEYIFKHALTEEVAYGSQLARSRAASHAAVATALAALDPERLDERASLIAHHHEAGGQLAEAARWNARAATWAGFSQPLEAARHWRRVRDLTDRLGQPADLLELAVTARLMLLSFLWRSGAAAEAAGVPWESELSALFSEAEALANRAGQPALLANALATHGLALTMAGAVQDGYDQQTRAMRLADQTGDLNLRVVTRMGPTYTLYVLGRFEESTALADEMSDLIGDDRSVARGIVVASPYAWCRQAGRQIGAHCFRLDHALVALEESIAIAGEEDDWESQVWGRRGYAVVGDLAGSEADTALAHAREGLRRADEAGGPFSRVFLRNALALSYAQRADWEAAIATVEDALDLLHSRRIPIPDAAYLLATRARAHIGLGSPSAARVDAAEAISVAQRCGAPFYEAVARLELARALLAAPVPTDMPQAHRELDEALAIAERLHMRAIAPQIHLGRADLATALGDLAAAEAATSTAHRLFLEVGAIGRAEQVAGRIKT
jgi:adenylate cyclase